MNEKTSAQDTIKLILTGVDIQKVVSVDDYYAKREIPFDAAVELFQTARLHRDAEYSELIPRDILDADESIWTRRLESYWSGIPLSAQLTVMSELAVVTGTPLSNDARDLSLLRTLVPEEMLITMTPTDWEQNWERVLADAHPKGGILCLFDQDLRLDNYPSDGGITLLKKLLGLRGDRHVICGLLTHTISEEAEPSEARRYAKDMDLSLDEFLPLSKERLRGDPMEFATGLKLTVMNYARKRLAKQVSDLAEAAGKQAQASMNEISIQDFEHIVVRSSEIEGIWEPETLFRLFDIFRYNAFREKALESTTRTALYINIERLRTLRNTKTASAQPDSPSDLVYPIRHAELYDTGDLLNHAHQSVDLGDIFEIGEGKFYILLAQPCDLMIRSKPMGKRGIDIATLVRIQTYESEAAYPNAVTSYQLSHFALQPGPLAFVKFRSSFQISLNVLDLAVINDDGVCRIAMSKDIEAEQLLLHEPWRQRVNNLRKFYKSTHSEFEKIRYGSVSEYQKKALRHLVLCSDENIALEYSTEGTFEFGIRRVMRYRAPFSVHLLSAYYSFLSRNPQEHDYTKRG